MCLLLNKIPAVADGKLMLQHCDACGGWSFPVRERFPHCFAGKYNDMATTMRLSPDKKEMTETMDNPLMDPRTCQVVRHNTMTLRYVR